MAITYYLLLQDRIEDALGFFKKVDSDKLQTQIQYDYFKAYISFYLEDVDTAKNIVAKYQKYPVLSWRNKFLEIQNNINEITGKETKQIDTNNRQQQMTQLASKEATFDFVIEGKQIIINHSNLASCKINYYLMDLEFLFSKSPFAKDYGKQFSYIKPNANTIINLNSKETQTSVKLPPKFNNSNLLIEISASGKKSIKTYFANDMNIKIEKNYGQLKVSDKKTNKPLPKAYVKVYARMNNGKVKFYKDGYTDLRGRFDYTSLNTNEFDSVKLYSILIMTKNKGAVVKEAAPPKQ